MFFSSTSPLQRAMGALLFAAVGCSGDGENPDETEDLDPPSLRIESVTNTNGTRFTSEDENVVVACDARLVVRVGPNSGGLLDNWFLRPRGTCDELEQCGHVRLDVETPEGDLLSRVERAQIDLSFEAPPVDSDRLVLRATLIHGDDQRPFEVDGAAVRDEWQVQLQRGPCDDGTPPAMGGMGGMKGEPTGGTAGSMSLGGLGGMGGS